jgi:hypothetical protein
MSPISNFLEAVLWNSIQAPKIFDMEIDFKTGRSDAILHPDS